MNEAEAAKFLMERRDNSDVSRQKYRTEFARDRDRIIHSEEFRKLQTKSQIFGTVWLPHLFSRATHSLQVGQIGRSIGCFLKHRYSEEKPPFHWHPEIEMDPDLIEAICLAHDIGHPPFGHAGERALSQQINKVDDIVNGGFEGNAQTFRVITRTATHFKVHVDKNFGLNSTRAVMLGVLKYPWTLADAQKKGTEKFSFYGDDFDQCSDWLLGGLTKDIHSFSKDEMPRTLACSIMDWADTIAYAVHDFQDAITAGFIRSDTINGDDFQKRMSAFFDYDIKKRVKESSMSELHDRFFKAFRFAPPAPSDVLLPWMEISGPLISNFIEALYVEKTKFPYPFDKTVKMKRKEEDYLNYLRGVIKESVICDVRVTQTAYKVGHILERTFLALTGSIDSTVFDESNVLPRRLRERLHGKSKSEKVRSICDYICALSEGQTIDIYKRLYEPSLASPYSLIV